MAIGSYPLIAVTLQINLGPGPRGAVRGPDRHGVAERSAAQHHQRGCDRDEAEHDQREPAGEVAPAGRERRAALSHAREAQRERGRAALGELATIAAHERTTAC